MAAERRRFRFVQWEFPGVGPTGDLTQQEHRMSRFLHRLGGSAARHPWRVIGAWAAAARCAPRRAPVHPR